MLSYKVNKLSNKVNKLSNKVNKLSFKVNFSIKVASHQKSL